jgi:hypothetical protein
MNPALSKKARHRIETLCELGCSEVNQLLEKARAGDELDELSEFTSSEILLIIAELNEIMSVYEAKE